jgi:hypothetical protein
MFVPTPPGIVHTINPLISFQQRKSCFAGRYVVENANEHTASG